MGHPSLRAMCPAAILFVLPACGGKIHADLDRGSESGPDSEPTLLSTSGSGPVGEASDAASDAGSFDGSGTGGVGGSGAESTTGDASGSSMSSDAESTTTGDDPWDSTGAMDCLLPYTCVDGVVYDAHPSTCAPQRKVRDCVEGCRTSLGVETAEMCTEGALGDILFLLEPLCDRALNCGSPAQRAAHAEALGDRVDACRDFVLERIRQVDPPPVLEVLGMEPLLDVLVNVVRESGSVAHEFSIRHCGRTIADHLGCEPIEDCELTGWSHACSLMRVLRPRRAAGEACVQSPEYPAYQECARGRCESSDGEAFVCVATAIAGEPCRQGDDGELPDCDLDSICGQDGRCVRLPGLREACEPETAPACSRGLACDPESRMCVDHCEARR